MSAGTTDRRQLARDFVRFAIDSGVLGFGRFKMKSGRMSPYFFNAGLFSDGASLSRLGEFYADALLASGIEFDVIFGPAYKGIVLATAVAMALARRGVVKPFAYNRKEAKDHGEGGVLVGAPLKGRVLIVDDVMTAGTAVRESIALIRAAGATPHAVAIALDREEKAAVGGRDMEWGAVEYAHQQLGLQVCAIATLTDLLQHLAASDELREHWQAVMDYRSVYGVTGTAA